jgi:hypothetical protein
VYMRTSERSVIDGVKKLLFIDGKWREASGDDTIVVEDPSTGEALCEVADARPEDALAALGDGQADRGVAGRDSVRCRVLPLVLRGGRAHRRPLRRRAQWRGEALDHEAASGALPHDHALELPDGHGNAQDRTGYSSGLCRRLELSPLPGLPCWWYAVAETLVRR